MRLDQEASHRQKQNSENLEAPDMEEILYKIQLWIIQFSRPMYSSFENFNFCFLRRKTSSQKFYNLRMYLYSLFLKIKNPSECNCVLMHEY